MNHVKELILERKNFKPYTKYIDIVGIKLGKKESYYYPNFEKILIYEEDGIITISIKTWSGLNKDFIDLSVRLFGETNYEIHPQNGSQLSIDFHGVPESFLKSLDPELDANKFNL